MRHSLRPLLAAALAALAPLALSAQTPAPLSTAPGRWVVPVSPVGHFTEPGVAVDPNNPMHVVATYQGNAAVAYSTDGGKTFTRADGTSSTRYRGSGDVSITYDSRGHAILCYIAMDSLGTSQYWGHNATGNGIFVRRSLDGGKTWEKDDIAVINHETDPGVQIPFEDKPYVVADNNPQSPFYGNLYVGWTQDRLTDSGIMFSRSTDGGKTWSTPIQISHSSLPRDDNGMTEGFVGAVTPDGVLHTAWAGQYDEIRYASSSDGGKTFTPSRTVVKTGPSRFRMPGFSSRNGVNGYPQISEVPGKGGRAPHLYVTWSDYTNGEVDVFAVHSDDEGTTWSAPVKVNSDAAHDGFDHFFQWMAADPATGDLYVSFYDRRFDPSAGTAQFVLARSTDDGKTFTNYIWSMAPFSTDNVVLGDYTGLTALDGCVYGVWAETRPSSGKTSLDFRGRPSPYPPTVVVVGGANFKTTGSCTR
jgi:hypothetical protein